MPNPPITVGELTDVPAPESPINAQFHQEVANRIVHRFASVGAMNGWAAANGSLAFVAPDHYRRVGGAWVQLADQSDVDALASTVTSNDANLQAQIDALPRGMYARVHGVEHANITGPYEVCRVTYPADANRWHRTMVQVPALYNQSVSGKWHCVVSIQDQFGTTQSNGVVTLDPAEYAAVELSAVESGIGGSIVRRLMVTPQGGGTFWIQATGSYTPPFISIEDCGAV